MANGTINEIVSKDAEGQVRVLIAQLQGIRKEIDSINKQPINVPSDSRNNSNRTSSVTSQIIAQREASIKAIERERLAEIKLQIQRENAFDKYEASVRKQIQLETQKNNKARQESEKIIAQKEKEFRQFEKEFTKYEADLKRKEIAEQKAALSSQKAAEKKRLAEIKLQQQIEKRFDTFEKGYAKEQAALARAESIYTKVQAKVTSLTATYNNLAAKRELGLNLNTRETAQLTSLESRLTKYQNVLKNVDAGIGKYTRNVGNYASGFNPLNNAIGQFARELPNAGISFQTFAVSLSNQFGQLIDATNGVIAQNKQLIAQGQPVKSVFSQILSAALSLQTGLFIGIALFTAYSKEIGEMASNLFKSTAAFNSVEQSAKALNDIRIESLKAVTEEKLALQGNLAIAKDTTRSYQDREIAAQKVLDQYPYWFESLGKEAILNGNVEKALNGVNNALLARARANAAIGRITENQTRIIDLEEERRVLLENVKAVNAQIRVIQRRSTAASSAERQAQSEDIALGKRENLKRDLAKVEEELAGLITVNNRLSREALASQANAIGLDAKQIESKKKVLEFELEAETNSREAFERNISTLETRLSLISKENSAYGLLSTQLQLLKMAYEAMYGEQEKANEETEKTIKYGTVDYYNSLISKLRQEQEALVDNTEAYHLYESAISSIKDQLEDLTNTNSPGSANDLNKRINELTQEREAVATTTEEYAQYTKQIKEYQDELDKLTGKYQERINKYLDGFTEQIFSDAGFKTLFKSLNDDIEGFGENWAVTFNTISEIAQETFNFLNQNSQAYFDAEYARLNQEKEIALQFAGESSEGREEINRQYDERRREIRLRELKAEKDQAIFNAVINTAQGVTAALAKANIPLSVIVGALGAAQIALIASREIPAYKEGVIGHEGGLAIVGDGGRSEIIQTPSGSLFKTPSTDTLIDLPKGSNVYKSEADFLKNSGTLLGGMPHINLEGSKGLTQSQLGIELQKAFGSIQTVNMNLDRQGLNVHIQNQSAKTVKLNNLVSFKGISVK